MNDKILKSLIKPFLPMLPGILKDLDKKIHEQLKQITLDKNLNEERAAYFIITGEQEKCFIVECTLDSDDKIVRTIKAVGALEFLQETINKSI